MAKYQVLRPIEYEGKLYLPAGIDVTEWPCSRVLGPDGTCKSLGNGEPIQVDSGGLIDLPDGIAAQMTLGQIGPLDRPIAPHLPQAVPTGKQRMATMPTARR